MVPSEVGQRDYWEATMHPPYAVADYPTLLALYGPEEFERTVCPLDIARERYRGYREGRRGGYVVLEAYVLTCLARGSRETGTGRR